MNYKILLDLGLSKTQAKLYETMISTGPITISKLATKAGENRTTAHMAIEKLELLGLVRHDSSKKSVYIAENPVVLKRLLMNRQEEIKQSSKELRSILPLMQSRYNLHYNQPGVLHLEGVQAIKELYEDIIRRNEEVLIFPSKYDHDDPETAALIADQIKKQFRAGIPVRAIYSDEHKLSEDQLLVLARKGIQVKHFGNRSMHEAQIMIYGDTVAMTTFKRGVYTTIMNSPDVASNMRAIFENMWVLSG